MERANFHSTSASSWKPGTGGSARTPRAPHPPAHSLSLFSATRCVSPPVCQLLSSPHSDLLPPTCSLPVSPLSLLSITSHSSDIRFLPSQSSSHKPQCRHLLPSASSCSPSLFHSAPPLNHQVERALDLRVEKLIALLRPSFTDEENEASGG